MGSGDLIPSCLMIEIRQLETGSLLLRLPQETLSGARLAVRDLRGADLRFADLSRARLQRALFDTRTRGPLLFRPGSSGCVRLEEPRPAYELVPAPSAGGRGDEAIPRDPALPEEGERHRAGVSAEGSTA